MHIDYINIKIMYHCTFYILLCLCYMYKKKHFMYVIL